MPCTIGRGGSCAAADKREGDGCTPLGVWPIRGVLLRPGKVEAAGIRLPWRWLREGDGWSDDVADPARSEEHTSELQSLMRISYAVFCLKKKKTKKTQTPAAQYI